MLIGLIADTHMPFNGTVLWEEVRDVFSGVDLILHAGDIVHPVVLDWLETIAPVLAARGNNDGGIDDRRLQDIQLLDAGGLRLAMVHDMEPEDRPIDYLRRTHLRDERVDVMITGHTHFERLDFRDGVLQLNPGSATLPHLWSYRLGTAGLLDLRGPEPRARIVRLGESDGLRNPGVEYAFAPATGVVRLPQAEARPQVPAAPLEVIRLVSFDIDGTLEVGRPPGLIPMALVRWAKARGWLIGSCSDRPAGAQESMWAEHGIEADFAVVKTQLEQVRVRFGAGAYVHIGDTEVDRYYARLAGFEFLHVDDAPHVDWLRDFGLMRPSV